MNRLTMKILNVERTMQDISFVALISFCCFLVLPFPFFVPLNLYLYVIVIILHFLQIKREISTMKLIRHPNVIRMYEV